MSINKIFNKYHNAPLPLKASIWFFICSFLQRGISIISTPIFTRLLSTYEYGQYNLFVSWSDVLGIFITFGLSSSVYQKKLVEICDEQERNRFTSSLQGLATVTTCISFAIYYLFHKQLNLFFSLETNTVIAIYVSTLMATAFGFWAMRQRVNYRYKRLIALTIITSILKPVLGVILILSNPKDKVAARILSIVIVEVTVYMFLYVKQFVSGNKFFDKSYWKYAISFVLPLIPHYISQRILSQSDRIMINSMVGSSAAGIYSLAHSVGLLLTMIVSISDSTIAPWFYTKLRDKEYSKIRTFSRYPIVLMGLFCLGFVIVVPEVIRFFAPTEYYDAIWILPPFILSTYYMMVYTLFIYFEYFFEETKNIMTATVCSAVLNIVLNYIFIKLYGYQAAAYTSLICYAIYAFFHYLVIRKICIDKTIDVNTYDGLFIAISSVIVTLFGLLIMTVYNHIILRYCIVSGVCLVIICNKRKIVKILKNSNFALYNRPKR